MEPSQQTFKTRMEPPQPSPVFARAGGRGTLASLPTSFHAWLTSEKEIPNIRQTPLTEVYKILSMHLECLDYSFNLATFWYLDILSEALEVAQEEMNMNQRSQKSLLAWFAHILSILKCNKNWTREEAFGNLHITILAAGSRLTQVGWDLPVPQDLKNSSSAFSSPPSTPRYTRYPAQSSSSMTGRTSSLTDMSSVVQLLYSVFANAFQFELIKAAFCTPPRISEHVIPHTIHFPKQYKPPPVIVQPSSSKRRGTKDHKEHKPKSQKHKKESESPTEEELLQEQAAKLAKMEEEKLLYILPLQDAITEEYIHKLFHIEKEHVKHDKEHVKHKEHDKNGASHDDDGKKSKDKAGKEEKGGKKGKKK